MPMAKNTELKMVTSSPTEAYGGVAGKSPRPMPPQAPPPSATKHENPRVTFEPIPDRRQGLEDFLHRCAVTLGTHGGIQEEESLRRVLKAWIQESSRRDNETKRPKQGRTTVRPRQRPSLPPEARGTPGEGAREKRNEVNHSLLAVCGSQVELFPQNGRGAGAAAARWEKRYNLQVSITEEALLAKRSAEISLREAERVLHSVRAEAANAVREAATAREEAAKALEARGGGRDEKGIEKGFIRALEAKAIFTKIETDLRRRLQETKDRLAQSKEEGIKLHQVLTECLASLGLVRGVPDEEFHKCLSALRDRAEEAGRGFLSVEGLHTAAEGARALDASRPLKQQLQEAQLDASQQRTRRIDAEARLMEKEEGDRARGASATSDREEILKARKAAEEMRTRMEVAEAQMQRLKDALREEGTSAAPGERTNASAPMAVDVRSIFEEGHRCIQQKMRIKAQEAQKEMSQIHEESEARLREIRNINNLGIHQGLISK